MDNNLNCNKFLNKKRKKSKSQRKRKSSSCISLKIEENTFIPKDIFEKKNEDPTKKSIQRFFNFNWDESLPEKTTSKIAKFFDSTVYWYMINSSYFSEYNLEQKIKIIEDNYLEIKNYNSSCEKMNIQLNDSINPNDNININTTDSDDYNKIIPFDKKILSIICCCDYLNKSGKNYLKRFDHKIIDIYRNNIKKYLLYINKINEGRLSKLKNKYKFIQKEYNRKLENSSNKEKFNCQDYEIEPNIMFSENTKSLIIRKKFWDYLYKKEKDYLLKRETQKTNKLEKDEEEDEEIRSNNCCICNGGDLGSYENIYECVNCSIKVHQECYGIKQNTEQKNWKCSKCKKMPINEAKNLECFLCPCKGGAMKQTKIQKASDFYKTLMRYRTKIIAENTYEDKIIDINNTTSNQKYLDYPWIHLTCAFGNKDVKLSLFGKKRNFHFEDNNIIENYNGSCHICKINNFGPSIKCKNEDCNIYCHPECARINNYYIEIVNLNLSFYCHKHRPNRFKIYLNKLSKSYNEVINFFGDALDCAYKLYEQNKNEQLTLNENEELITNKIIRTGITDKIKELKPKKKYLKTIKKLSKHSKNHNKFTLNSNNKFNKVESYDNKKAPIFSVNLINSSVNDMDYKFNKIESSFTKNSKTMKSKNINSYTNSLNEINIINNDKNYNYNNSNGISNSPTESESGAIFSENKKSELIDYITKFNECNRIILNKNDGSYSICKKEDEEELLIYVLKNLTFKKLKEGEYDFNQNKELNSLISEVNNENDLIFKDEDEIKMFYENNKKNIKISKRQETKKENEKNEKQLCNRKVGKSKYKK